MLAGGEVNIIIQPAGKRTPGRRKFVGVYGTPDPAIELDRSLADLGEKFLMGYESPDVGQMPNQIFLSRVGMGLYRLPE